MQRVRSSARKVAPWLPVFLVPVILVGCVLLYGTSHRVLPGLEGCSHIRSNLPRIQCYSTESQRLVDQEGAPRAIADVERRATRDASLASDCHLALHSAGERAGRGAGTAGEGLPALDTSSWCSQGYAHGFVIGYFGVTHAGAIPTETISRVCASGLQGDAVNCIHAFGHIFARRAGSDLNVADEGCAQLNYAAVRAAVHDGSTTTALRDECYRGLYMEYSLRDVHGQATRTTSCANAPVRSQPMCYAWLPQRVTMLDGSIDDAAQACHIQAPAGRDRSACVARFAELIDDSEQCRLLPAASEVSLCRTTFAAIAAGQRPQIS